MRTLVIEHDGVRICDHRGYIETEILEQCNQNDIFELHRGNRGFSVRWLFDSQCLGPMTKAWFQRINVIENHTKAQVVNANNLPQNEAIQ